MSLSTTVAELVFKTDTKQIDKANQKFGAFTKTIGNAAAGLVAGFTARAVWSGMDKISTGLVDLANKADNLGVATEQLQGFRFAAEQMGIGTAAADEGLSKLSESIGKATGGSKEMVKTFKDLGIEVKNVDGSSKNAGDVMKDLNRVFSGNIDPTKRAALAQKLLGGAAKTLTPLLSKNTEEFEAQLKLFEDLGGPATKDAIEKSKRFKNEQAQLGVVSDSLKESLFSLVMDGFGGLEGIKGAIKNINDFIGDMTLAEKKTVAQTTAIAGLTLTVAKFAGPLGGLVVAGGAIYTVTNYLNNEFDAALRGGESSLMDWINRQGVSTEQALKAWLAFKESFSMTMKFIRLAAETSFTLIITKLKDMAGGAMSLIGVLAKLPGVGKHFQGISDAGGRLREEAQNQRESLGRDFGKLGEQFDGSTGRVNREAEFGATNFRLGQTITDPNASEEIKSQAARILSERNRARNDSVANRSVVVNQNINLQSNGKLADDLALVKKKQEEDTRAWLRQLELADGAN